MDEAKSPLVLITEVKQEIMDSSDEEAIWIVQAESEAQGNQNKQTSDKVDVKTGAKPDKEPKCNKCLQILCSAEAVKAHKCRKRERKRNAKVDSAKKPQKKKGKSLTEPRIVTCDICDEAFSSKVRLKFHMQFHEPSANITADGEYLCSQCDGATFPSETELFDHVHFQHEKKKRWQCPTEGCGKTFFMRATLTKHIRTHTDTRRYVCVTCGKQFLNKQTLDEHSVTHLQIKPFSCHICLKQLTRRSRLRMHLRSHEEEPSPRLVLACAVCRRAFATPAEATEHVTMSTECLELFALEVKKETEAEELSPTTGIVTKNSVNKSSDNDPIEREVNTSESAALLETVDDVARAIVRVVNIEKAFRCEYCEDVFYMEDALNKHRTIHKGVKNPFICHICKVSFATYSRCTTHKTTHGFYKRKEKDVATNNAGPNAGILGYGGFPVAKHFLCEDCGRSYLHWTYLQVHRRMKHDNQDVLFQCNDCKSTFPNCWSVAYHRKKVHGKSAGDDGITKIKKESYGIPCRDCDQLLANKNALYKHRLKEHSDQSLGEINKLLSEEKCMTCGKCGLQVHKLGDLEKHLREVHDEEQQMFSYDAHASTQGAGERRYRCELCGVSFNRAATMRNHRQIHSGLIRMKWSCERCPRRFSARAELRTHMRLKHPEHLAVIEIEGLNPSPEVVLNYLKMKNIQQRNVIDITMISFAQGTTNIVPNSARALSLLNDVPRTNIAREDSTFPRGVGIMQAPRPETSSTYSNNWPSIIRPNTGTVQDYFSIPTKYESQS
ncbi:zinc finger protein 91 [Aricia agestis]|uniref:zinc finger protein 91 n=1 Tax=Aricia agestis TaxID=91739 RepID=UPI001C20229F|nr:zinc finger protein 91 [Aricia agestis]